MFKKFCAYFLLLIIFFIRDIVFAQVAELGTHLLSTNQLKIVSDYLTNQDPKLKGVPLYVNTLSEEVNGKDKNILSFLNFVGKDFEELYLVLSKIPQDKKFSITGSVLVNNLFQHQDDQEYAVFPYLYPINNKDLAVLLLSELSSFEGDLEKYIQNAKLIKLGLPSQVLADIPFSCSLQSVKCPTSGNMICNISHTKTVDFSVSSQRKTAGYYDLELQVASNIKQSIDGIDTIKETKNKFFMQFDRKKNQYVFKDKPDLVCNLP